MSAITTAESKQASQEAQLLESYRPARGVFDELSDGAGIRPRWRELLESFAAMGPEATQAAQDKAQRQLLENGVTFAAQDDDGDNSRPWRLDLFPLLIGPEEW